MLHSLLKLFLSFIVDRKKTFKDLLFTYQKLNALFIITLRNHKNCYNRDTVSYLSTSKGNYK